MKPTLIQRFALWILKVTGYEFPKPQIRASKYVMAAAVHCAEFSSWEASGEARRHQVYARLIKQFPEARKKDLSLAIELALHDAN